MENTYLEILQNPPEEAKGYTRWWWYGCAVTRVEISRQMKLMKEANIGGIEIQILYPISKDDKELGIKNIQYFSPEFFDIIDFTVAKADELGMKVDFTLGSSWPYGGPFVSREMAPQSAIPYQIDVTGPRKFSYDYTTKMAGRIDRVIMGKMENGKMLENSIVDITDNVKEKYLFSWPWGYTLDEIDIPEGNWKIVSFVIAKYREMVLGPAPNAEGYAIDHCRKDISDYFFDSAGQPIVDRIGKGLIRSFFCDSLELDGNNWTEIMFDEFKERRGYSLEPYIYALWGEVDDISPYIRHDYYKTMSELTIENFFENFTKWCNENNSKSRIQVHGTWGDVLKAYGAADIPEGETFGAHDQLKVNTIHRRLATSAGHIYNRPIISNESFTWLRTPRYLVTLENIKAAVDAIFLDGINHIINHGYSYTPEFAGQPGWAFYASSHICHTNTWWPYYKEVGKYIQKVSSFLQMGKSYSEVGIYLPQGDVWSDNQMANLHLAMQLEEYMGTDTVDNINKAGYYFDYLNDEAIQEIGNINDNGLNINGNPYKVIILINCNKMPLETATKLKEFVKQGGILIAAEYRPNDTCGFLNRLEEKDSIDKIMQEIFDDNLNIWKKFGKGQTIVTQDRKESLIESLRESFVPDARIKEHNDTIGYVHRKNGKDDIYFISNISKKLKTTEIEFKISGKGILIIDPISEKEILPVAIKYNSFSTSVKIDFPAYQSYIVIFSEEQNQEELICKSKVINNKYDLTNNWTFKVPSKNFTKEMDTIHTWEIYPELKYYSGEGYYEKELNITKNMLKQDKLLLTFEHIGEVAEIHLNDKQVGVLWKLPREIDIKDYVKEGKNRLIIKVVNLLINDAIDPDKEEPDYLGPVIDEWPYFSEVMNPIRRRRLYNQKERDLVKEPLPSGVSGKVTIVGLSM